MIFVLAQALDNASEDRCVVDGSVLDAAAPEASQAMALLSDTTRRGKGCTEGTTEITDGPSGVAVKVSTSDRDAVGRRAPIVAVFGRQWLHDLEAASALIADYAGSLDRSVDRASLSTDLLRWQRSGKANGGHLSRVGRQISQAAQRALLALVRGLRAVFGK